MGYRIDVVTDDVPGAISHVGGFLCDRARAGWQVVVVTEDTVHSRALAILGARREPPGALHAADHDLRTVMSAVGGSTTPGSRHLFWEGRADRRATSSALHPVRHHLSLAARMFKAHALLSSGLTAGVERWEYLWTASIREALGFTDLPPDGAGAPLSDSVH